MFILNCNDKILYPLLHSYNCQVEQDTKAREQHVKQSKVEKIQRFLNIFRERKEITTVFKLILKNLSPLGIT